MTPSPIPLRPDPRAVHARAMQTLTRACITAAMGKLDKSITSQDFARKRWGADAARDVELLAGAASAPASTSGPGWADTLGHVVPAYLANLVPFSAGADLLGRALQIDFAGARTITLPMVVAPLADFVAEMAAIPVVDGTSSTQPSLSPFKFAVIIVLTREMVEYSPAEALVRDALLQSSGPALDRRLFDANPGILNTRPPGLLNGIAALTPSGAVSKTDAMQADLETLIAAVSPVAGNSDIVVIAAPAQAVSIAVRTFGSFQFPVLRSSALAAGTVIAIAVRALASASGAAPEIDTTTAASLHMSDTPLAIVDGGAPAAPVKAIFQDDALGLRLRWPLSWTVRDARAVAWMANVGW
jgi:hypothetical protein